MSERAGLFQRCGLITRGQGSQINSTQCRSEDGDKAPSLAKDDVRNRLRVGGSEQQVHGMLGSLDLLERPSGSLIEQHVCGFLARKHTRTAARADSTRSTSQVQTKAGRRDVKMISGYTWRYEITTFTHKRTCRTCKLGPRGAPELLRKFAQVCNIIGRMFITLILRIILHHTDSPLTAATCSFLKGS